ncbi:hypothetical protein E4U42_002495 [Claviceps africana]|uniref:MYST-type HAT domain-containing protein n=1 Tax=Claviceps africana TaxID=83212 RepID=A0A8K0JCR6_9HYPO|nr:hypothetical protein E4U42_002495 [Claviceps africana]
MAAKRRRPEQVPRPAAQDSSTRRVTRQTPVLPPRPPTSTASRVAQAAGPAAPAGPSTANTTPTTATAPAAPPTTTAGAASSSQTPVPIPAPPGRPPARHRGRPPTALRSPLVPSVPAVQTPVPVPAITPASPRSVRPMLSAAAGHPHSSPGQSLSGVGLKEKPRSSDLVAPEITYHVPQPPLPGRIQSSLLRPHGPSAPPPRSERRPAPPVVTPVPPPKPPTLAVNDRVPPRADRNIDKVVLGNLCFRTWYPSYYGKEVLGDASGNARNGGGSKEGGQDTNNKHSKRDKDTQAAMLERLYVCPSCFKYAKELVAWRGHVRVCERNPYVPGKKIYTHPRGRRSVLVAHDSGKGPGPKRRRGDGGVRYTEEIVQDEGEWSIWEVDGEKNGLFCQNLSLFAKLFLDNKSVFFDVSGFNYFLLVYTPPAKPSAAGLESAPNHAPQVTGFFSKEKMSWDNNNLACILVFPPWQRKGLGALLMGASYEISRREGILGGPEKPISDLGKKSYKRFWSGEISRWLLGLDSAAHPEQRQTQPQQGQIHVQMPMPVVPATPRQQQQQEEEEEEEDEDEEKAAVGPAHELVIDIDDCSRGTWIAAEDCLSVLRDMGIVEDAGMGYGKPRKSSDMEESETRDDDQDSDLADAAEQTADAALVSSQDSSHSSTTSSSNSRTAEAPPLKLVPRVRVDKEAVRRYVATHRISLERTCDPNGFAEGYAIKPACEGDTDGAKQAAEST